MTDYFKELEEESLRDNFNVIYDLFDELNNFGYSQITDRKILNECHSQEGYKLHIQSRILVAVTNAFAWCFELNEVFLDVI